MSSFQPQIVNVRFEHHHDGLGIATGSPRISWSFSADPGKVMAWEQGSYEIETVILSNGLSAKDQESRTVRVDSTDSLLVPWPLRPLRSFEAAKVRVRVCGKVKSMESGNTEVEWSDWSPSATVEAAVLDQDNWQAALIEPPSAIQLRAEDGSMRPLRFRSQLLKLPAGVTRARLYMTAHGVYQAYINGKPVGDQLLAPGWTSYKNRLNYVTFSVTDLLRDEPEARVEVEVAPGWLGSALGWAGGRRCRFGNTLGVFGQLRVDFQGQDAGQASQIWIAATDETWECAPSAITQSEIYNGETYDARLRDPAKASEVQWARVQIGAHPGSRLVSPEAPPVRVTEKIATVDIIKSPTGRTILDFGQNIVGKICVNHLNKPEGHEVRFAHAEVLENGELCRRPLRFAASEAVLISRGDLIEGWSPLFSFHGFRYVQVDGWSVDDMDGPLTKDSVTALVMHSDMRRTEWFESSHPLLNKLHENAVWSMRGNFLSIPTDCPQRDERLGWTGDIQVFSPSANFLYDTNSVLGGWMADVMAEQAANGDGVPPFVVPNVIGRDDETVQDEWWPHLPNAVWDDVVVVVPWELYRASGDTAILERHYDSMQAWVDRGIIRGADSLWDEDVWQLGDWLDPAAPPSEPGMGKTDGVLVADAYLIRVTGILAEVAAILGGASDSARYASQRVTLIETFQHKYITSRGLMASDTQTAYALAITNGLIKSPTQRSTVTARLIRSVRQAQFRVSTGFAGTPIILHALSTIGHHQYAYRMLFEKQCPSWMYPVVMGATTIWERWDSMLHDGSINPGDMTSFNHCSLGSVVNWLHEVVAGLKAKVPGWKQIEVRPVPGGPLTHASARHISPYGEVESSWKISGGRFVLRLTVPPNCTAYVVLPDKHRSYVTGQDDEGVWVGSGRHNFSCGWEDLGDWPLEAQRPPFWPQPLAEAV
ncbi:hypothetical protein CkaCkLH20_08580 [Colletotrichum karsti]|uniref:alpha-L-rhamnosidase n=1 Tax=Colletotrichum karsti TaxID=1095194 RepID=A0A9P6I4H8_9PEZI|nr:uncharacterized protein CkaCkLH20_08580 [Colletotrichum karsti]KAF9873846.1 hypothetical protein CkaCkLH20_08580 [Colletotrichum karsti]